MLYVMADKCKKTVFVLILFVFLLDGPIAANPDSPKITDRDEIVIDANTDYELFCKGNKPMRWKIPSPSEHHKDGVVTTFSQKDETPIDSSYNFGRRLFIKNMTYPYVGYFYCHYEDAGFDDVQNSDKIYLYVNDSEVLSVVTTPFLPTVTVTQYQNVIIPCIPTSPDVDVQLMVPSTDEMINASYDPKLGYTFNVTDLSQQDYYVCKFQKGVAIYELYFSITVDLPTYYIATPILEDISYGHTVVGNKLVLRCYVKAPTQVKFHWFVHSPNGPIDESRMNVSAQSRLTDDIHQNITIYNTRLSDKGRYYCNVTDFQGHSSSNYIDVIVHDVNDHFIEMTEENNVTHILVSAGEPEVLWRIDVKGHPIPALTWVDGNEMEIVNNSKYETWFDDLKTYTQAFLKIKEITISDFGTYTLLAKNSFERQRMDLFLSVTDKPTVRINVKDFYMVNENGTVECVAAASPEPDIYLEIRRCQNGKCSFVPLQGRQDGYTSVVTINATEPTQVRCHANNSIGKDSAVATISVSDITNGFDIFGFDSTVEFFEHNQTALVALGDSVSFTCGVSVYNYSQAEWSHDGRLVQNDTRHILKHDKTKYSERQRLTLVGSNISDDGNYTCSTKDNTGSELTKSVTIKVLYPISPYFIPTKHVTKDVHLELGDKLTLSCETRGLPKPSVSWYKDGLEYKPSRPKVNIYNSNQNIHFRNTILKNEGTYKCVVTNRIGRIEREISVKFKYVPRAGLPLWAIVLLPLLIIAFIVAMIYILIKWRKEKELRKKLKKLGLDTFEKGAIENLNPELGVDDQAELLPYDKKWEFPREQLKLGKQLGSGAFGVVMKAVARHIVDNEDSTTVAVKMVKRTADYTHLKALASELKIMVHLGRHLNVVNLLGACTKNVAKKELFVIVEYCRFGNLQNYLLRHRNNFINQVDQNTGKIDYAIGQEYLERTYSISSEKSTGHSLPPNMKDYRESGYTTTSAITTLSQGNDCVMLSNNSVQPEWRSNYKGDYIGQVKPITTKDLVAWAFQVSRGMDYLASRKVLHGDLAARNILLADNSVVKICDFGLAKSMYKSDNYQKRGNPLLPVKWMAIESIRDRVFSTQSDVWSFGIVLWEFFSLAKTPYPGMEANEHLYNKLVGGYRMEPPEYAPKQVSKMMADCWHAKPPLRPSFAELCESLGDLLEDTVRKHYVDLNDPYLVMNTQRLQEGQSDYLSMLSPPTFDSLSSPVLHYMNDGVCSSSQGAPENEGYLCMKPNTIFSPRTDQDGVFDFDVNYKKDTDHQEDIPELLPMLLNSSIPSGGTTPTTPNSYWNPSYHVLSSAKSDNANEVNMINSKDNYVNMPQYKKGNNHKYGEKPVQYVNDPLGNWPRKSVEII